jgi:hypothetical protein
MLPNLSLPTRIHIFRVIRIFEKHQIIVLSVFFMSLLFSGSMMAFAQKTEVKKAHAESVVGITPTQIPTPTITSSPTSTPSPTLKPTITSTPIPTPTSSLGTPTPSTTNGTAPGKVLDLSNWKLTLPLGGSESPTEITQPTLATFVQDPWFVVAGGGVRFRAPVSAVTTSGSNYPRSELREMTNNGKDKASWSSTTGTHTMTIDEAITATPSKKPHVVAGQIHDANDDIIVIRLEGANLYVNVDGKNLYTLDSGYTLGKRFSVKFEASGGQTKVFYNGAQVYTLAKDYSGAYFKAGAYTQSNCSKEDVCSESNYGEVLIYSLSVSHS